MPPGPTLAVDLAEHVMQQHVGRAGRVRGREVADDRVPAERGLDDVGLEPVVQQFTGAFGQQLDQVAPPAHVQALQAPRDIGAGEPVGEHEPVADVRWRAVHQFTQHRDDAVEHRGVVRQPLRIPLTEARDLGLCRREPAAQSQRIAVGERQEVRKRPLDDPQAVFGKPQLADHLRTEQAHRVAGGRVSESRVEFLGDRGAAEHRAALEHTDLQAGTGEVRGADEAVVAAANDQRITGVGHVVSGGLG